MHKCIRNDKVGLQWSATESDEKACMLANGSVAGGRRIYDGRLKSLCQKAEKSILEGDDVPVESRRLELFQRMECICPFPFPFIPPGDEPP